jgi:ribose 5-phosphate isomerase B
MAANKIFGIRAALCVDAETARCARIWNHANVLTMSNRLLSNDVAREILFAWLETPYNSRGELGVAELMMIDKKLRNPAFYN